MKAALVAALAPAAHAVCTARGGTCNRNGRHVGAGSNRTLLPANQTGSRCVVTPERAECSYLQTRVGGRDVFYQVPDGAAPASGWPVVLYFHAWYAGGADDWAADYPTQPNRDGGVYWEVAAKKAVLDMGVAWVSPDATRRGQPCPGNRNCWWETNDPPYNVPDLDVWGRSDDAAFLETLFSSMRGGDLGRLDMGAMHAAGYSSGGFMVSRMAFNYEGMFKTFTSVAASLYYCNGCGLATCPETYLDEPELERKLLVHPPTLFLHGAADSCVTPLESAMYNRRLEAAGVATKYVSPQNQGHHWLPVSAEEMSKWIQRYS